MAGSDDYKIKNLIATIILCTTLSTLSFLGRLWGRSLSAVSLGWDDFFMASAVLGGWAVSADNVVGIHFGSGRHVRDLSPSDVKNWTITFWTFNFLQIAATTVLKLAILGLYRRTFVTRGFHRAINVVTAIILADSLGLVIALSLYCVPVAHFWDPSIPGKCINRVVYLTLASTSLLATDLILYLMPLPVIWNLHMTARRKFQLTFVLVLGGFTCITRVLQIIATSRLDFDDITWSNVYVAIWNLVEVHIGCVTANVPIMAPLVSRYSTGIPRVFRKPRPGPNSKSHVGNQEGFRRMEEQSYRRGASAPTIGKGQQLSAEELEMAGLGAQGILVRKEVEQNSHARRSLEGGLVDMVVESA
ncbi:MAG: hypothetical protein LQ349_006154 [Xanthoria aureola]|nr:MAG: hypothetical protein LQ349_006154 [Xanthoria aureola]